MFVLKQLIKAGRPVIGLIKGKGFIGSNTVSIQGKLDGLRPQPLSIVVVYPHFLNRNIDSFQLMGVGQDIDTFIIYLNGIFIACRNVLLLDGVANLLTLIGIGRKLREARLPVVILIKGKVRDCMTFKVLEVSKFGLSYLSDKRYLYGSCLFTVLVVGVAPGLLNGNGHFWVCHCVGHRPRAAVT